jgi:hypothetical protein
MGNKRPTQVNWMWEGGFFSTRLPDRIPSPGERVVFTTLGPVGEGKHEVKKFKVVSVENEMYLNPDKSLYVQDINQQAITVHLKPWKEKAKKNERKDD